MAGMPHDTALTPAPTVTRVPLADLQPDPDNARVHGEDNLDTIRASFTEFGQRRPLIIASDGKTVLAGNGRLQVAAELGWTHVWVKTFNGTDAQARAFAIAHNRTADLAEWDPELQLAGLQRIAADGLLASSGFNDTAMAEVQGAAGAAQMKAAQALAGLGPQPKTCPRCGHTWTPGGDE